MLRKARRMSSLPPRPAKGRVTLAALSGFVMFSATFALATAIHSDPVPGSGAGPQDPAMIAAEHDTRDLLDERMHLHLKRLHALAGAMNGGSR